MHARMHARTHARTRTHACMQAAGCRQVAGCRLSQAAGSARLCPLATPPADAGGAPPRLHPSLFCCSRIVYISSMDGQQHTFGAQKADSGRVFRFVHQCAFSRGRLRPFAKCSQAPVSFSSCFASGSVFLRLCATNRVPPPLSPTGKPALRRFCSQRVRGRRAGSTRKRPTAAASGYASTGIPACETAAPLIAGYLDCETRRRHSQRRRRL